MPSLTDSHTFSLPSSCSFLISVTDTNPISLAALRSTHFYLLGEGSNSIFVDDFEGVVVQNKIKGLESDDLNDVIMLRVGAGENWHDLITTCLKNHWYGMENLALIPGSVGAAPIQNIGAYGLEVSTFIESVEFIELETGAKHKIKSNECRFGYRDSIFKNDLAGKVLITHVNFVLPKSNYMETSYGELANLNAPTPEKIFNTVIGIRRKKLPDPRQWGNAGSFFKNPIIDKSLLTQIQHEYPDIPFFCISKTLVKVPAAWLIDKLGFKGKVLGGVQCHPHQPLVLVNIGSATGKDVLEFARLIMSRVKEKFNIELEPEVRLIGRNGLIEL
ncbi:UDP-N-acetylmuramate dehydrogenase [Alteromonas ponticola]|uniref:UDP-N-acetylenolpyruvoylglucosamine reductase n=1 Tax=Alteromonas aquimaris TaxID=2998417 RepID=A0ABT3PAC0_9ALTE|nr:UDP-N-acetylmuramate dehydrogenase [Alteromonas aquimaris]MCW8109717.1 UDP-N-acetylmuramate dehydrogenase [Alteromonas aquimaris]